MFDGANEETILSGLSDPWAISLASDSTNAEAPLPVPPGQVVIDHRVDNDPTLESAPWTFNGGSDPLNVDAGPGSEVIGGQTYRYWSTDDNSTASGGVVNYHTSLTTEQVTGNWRATARVRRVDAGGLDQLFHVDDGFDRWAFWLLEDSVQSRDDSGTFFELLSMDTTSAYHTYEMVFTPETPGVQSANDMVKFLIDGNLIATLTRDQTIDRLAVDGFQPMFRFGGASSGNTGQANWNYVAFSVPEPSSFAVLTMGLCATVLRRSRRAK